MREVASFMRMYPAYKLRDVLNEYAVTFFSLLNEGYRQQYQHYLMLANVYNLEGMKPEERKHFIKQLSWAAQHPSDILKPSGEGSSPAEIKKALGG